MNNPYNERFLQAFQHLQERGIVTSQKEFSDGVGFSESYFSGFRNGKRLVTPHLIANLYKVYRVSLYYLLIGYGPVMDEERKGEPIIKGTPEELQQIAIIERSKREILEKILEAKDEEISFLRALLKETIKGQK